jgi:hypothetical protein
LLTQIIGASVNIGIFFRVVALYRIDHYLGLLARGGIVEVDQWLPMHLSPQDGEVFTNMADIECAVPYLSVIRGKHLRGTLHYASFTLWL